MQMLDIPHFRDKLEFRKYSTITILLLLNNKKIKPYMLVPWSTIPLCNLK
jgi:hypothetical protein